MKRSSFPTGIIAIVVALSPLSLLAAENDLDFFEKRIRPVLSQRCEKCHSAATGKTSGGLALDTRTGWQKGGDNGAVIVPKKPDDSLIVKAIRYTDDVPHMPPDDAGGKLSSEQIEDIVEWVRRGAVDPRNEVARIGGLTKEEAQRWWSFQPLRTVQPTSITIDGASTSALQNGPATPIDYFIAAEYSQRGLRPVGQADKRTLVRRATFDLTGLPPTPDEISAFVADESPDAYARLLDRLLASPEYGERWGRHWLDVARYADTAGDGADYPIREAGKYRDWVIEAFRADQRYDEFVRDQIAGDILANASISGPASSLTEDLRKAYAKQVTATGFLAIGKRYGYNPGPDFQHLDFADAIDSIGRSLLGLSLGCARCHDHKYEPVSMSDYYGLYGILQSTKWSFPGGEEHKRPANFPPLIPAEEAKQLDEQKAAQLRGLDEEIAELKRERAKLDGRFWAGGVDLAFEAQALDKPPAAPWLSIGPNRVIAEAQSPYTHVHPAGQRGVRMGTGAPNEGIRYVFENRLKASPDNKIYFTLDFRSVKTDTNADEAKAPKGAYRLYVGRGVIESLAIECSVTDTEFAIRNGTNWEVVRSVEPNTWYTLQVTLDHHAKKFSGIVGTANELTEFTDKAIGPNWDGVVDTFICDGIGHVAGPAVERDLDNIGLQETPFQRPGATPVSPIVAAPDSAAKMKELDGRITAAATKKSNEAARPPYDVAYGVSEGTPANAKIQKRGEPDKPGDEVRRHFLEILGGDEIAANVSGSGRLQLAEWITRASNPLFARVYVNRVWQWHFGRGIVSTSSDFGTRGELPTHPDLLDWLTRQFIESGWSLKSLHRTMMMSRTYQLASDDEPANLRIDPMNTWCWRYSRRPLDAETLRDAMLAVSGGLDQSRPTGHPFPSVDTWAFTIHQPFHAVYDSNHRSVYLMVQRNRRHPYLALFDAADPNLSVAERSPTTTPTQTLYLMNSPFVHAQSELFAKRIVDSSTDDEERIRYAIESSQGCSPTSEEISDAMTFMEQYRKQLADRGQTGDVQQRGAWMALSRVLLTSNAFLYVE